MSTRFIQYELRPRPSENSKVTILQSSTTMSTTCCDTPSTYRSRTVPCHRWLTESHLNWNECSFELQSLAEVEAPARKLSASTDPSDLSRKICKQGKSAVIVIVKKTSTSKCKWSLTWKCWQMNRELHRRLDALPVARDDHPPSRSHEPAPALELKNRIAKP